MNRFTRSAVPCRWTALLSGAVLLMAVSLLALRPAHAAPAQQPQKLSASSVQVLRTQSEESLNIPESFRVATYENVLAEITKLKKFQNVYRDGDHTADGVSDLVLIKLVPAAYKAGSQKQREVTTVSGATSIKFNVQFLSKDGKVLMEKEIEGKVRFFGENLRATYDFAKKVAKVVSDSF